MSDEQVKAYEAKKKQVLVWERTMETNCSLIKKIYSSHFPELEDLVAHGWEPNMNYALVAFHLGDRACADACDWKVLRGLDYQVKNDIITAIREAVPASAGSPIAISDLQAIQKLGNEIHDCNTKCKRAKYWMSNNNPKYAYLQDEADLFNIQDSLFNKLEEQLQNNDEPLPPPPSPPSSSSSGNRVDSSLASVAQIDNQTKMQAQSIQVHMTRALQLAHHIRTNAGQVSQTMVTSALKDLNSGIGAAPLIGAAAFDDVVFALSSLLSTVVRTWGQRGDRVFEGVFDCLTTLLHGYRVMLLEPFIGSDSSSQAEQLARRVAGGAYSVLLDDSSFFRLLLLMLEYVPKVLRLPATDPVGQTKQLALSEVTRLSATRCTQYLLSLLTVTCHGKATEVLHDAIITLRERLFSLVFRPTLGFLISSLLDAADSKTDAKHRELRVESLSTLETLFLLIVEPLPFPDAATDVSASFNIPVDLLDARLRSKDTSLFKAASQTMACFAPGILSVLHRILMSDYRTGSRVLSHATRVFSYCMLVVLGDEALKHTCPWIVSSNKPSVSPEQSAALELKALFAQADSGITQQRLSGGDDEQEAESDSLNEADSNRAKIRVSQNKRWLRESTQRISLILPRIFSNSVSTALNIDMLERERVVAPDRGASVQIQLIICCALLLRACTRIVQPCTMDILTYIITAREQQVLAVMRVASAALDIVQMDVADSLLSDSHELLSTVQKELQKRLSSLAVTLQRASSPKQLSVLRLLRGYARMLRFTRKPDSSYTYIGAMWQSAFDQLSFCMLQALELDTTDVLVLERKEISTDELETVAVDEKTPDKKQDETSVVPAQGDEPISVPHGYYEVRFLHVTSREGRYLLLELIAHMALYAGKDAVYLLSGFLDLLVSSCPVRSTSGQVLLKPMQLETVLVLNQIVLGMTRAVQRERVDFQVVRPVLELVLRTYVETPLFSLEAGSTRRELMIGLLLRGIGDIAEALNKNVFPGLLIDILYPVLSKLGDPSSIVQQAAHTTLLRLARVCAYTDVNEMIVANADYVIDAIALELRLMRRQARKQQVPDSSNAAFVTRAATLPTLLSILFQRRSVGVAIMPLLDDIVEHVLHELSLKQSSFLHHNEQHNAQNTVFLRVLLTIVQAISVQSGIDAVDDTRIQHFTAPRLTSDMTGKPRADGPVNPLYDAVSVSQRFHAYIRRRDEIRRFREGYDFDNEDFDPLGSANDVKEDEEAEAEQEKKSKAELEAEEEAKKGTPTQQLVARVLRECRHLLASYDIAEQIIVLRVIAQGIHILAPLDNVLLPACAQLWPSFKARFHLYRTAPFYAHEDRDFAAARQKSVLMAALGVLQTLAVAAARFLAQRFHGELWPLLRGVLQVEFRQMMSTNESNSSMNSSACKTQLVILTVLRNLLANPDCIAIIRADIRSVVQTVQWYLSNRHPKELQMLAVDLCCCAAQTNADVVFAELAPLIRFDDSQYVSRASMTAPVQVNFGQLALAAYSAQHDHVPGSSASSLLQLAAHRLTRDYQHPRPFPWETLQTSELEDGNEWRYNVYKVLHHITVEEN